MQNRQHRHSQVCHRARRITQLLALVLSLGLTGVAAGAQDDAKNYPMRADRYKIAVDPDIPPYRPCPPLQGDLYIGGGTAPVLIDLWVEIFHRAHPSVVVHRGDWGKATVMPELIENSNPTPFSGHKVQVCFLGEEFLPYEVWYLDLKQYYPILQIPVIGGAMNRGSSRSHVIIVHKDNPIQKLTMPQIDAIYSKTRKLGYKEDITRWGQLGLTGEWADKTINPWWLAGVEGGAAAIFRIRVLNEAEGGLMKDNVKDLAESQAKRYPPIPGAHPLDTDRYAMCEGSHWHDKAEQEKHYGKNVKIVPIGWTDAGPFYSGNLPELLNQTYPLAYRGYLVITTSDRRTRESNSAFVKSGKPRDAVGAEFVRAVLSREGQEAVARTDYMPLPASWIKASLEMMKGDPADYESEVSAWP